MISLVLFVIYVVYIQHERGGLWEVCRLAAIPGYFIDILANYTELALLTWDFPRRGEWTFSTRLSRLIRQKGWRGALANRIAGVLNRIAPSGSHVE